MKLVLTLLVRDEEDIIRENILFHLNQGVDFIIATDNNSVDSTPDILREFEKQGVLHLINETQDDYSQAIWVTRMARMAVNSYGADWVINSDADEFWWPQTGNLKKTLKQIPADVSVLKIERNDFIIRDYYDSCFYERMIYKKSISLNHLGKPLPPKVCHRGFADVIVKQGNHGLVFPENANTIETGEIEIFHFPMRSFAQFENKIKLGGAAYGRNTKLNKNVGNCWRMLYNQQQKGGFNDFVNAHTFSQSEIESKLNNGDLTIDPRLRDYLISISGR
ncbi:MAG: glycosyltransferase family 2 protein [Bacteroidota bacterium]|nr:glycosyltransferase family 2 protein [Bacteroidota bacterium]